MKRKPRFSIFSMVLFVCLAGSPISSSAGGSDYYVVIDGEQKGPMATEQLENLKQDGTITSDTLVWKDGMAEWGKAGEQEDLKTLFAAATPPPPPSEVTVTPPAPPVTPTNQQKDVITKAGSPDKCTDTKTVNKCMTDFRQVAKWGREGNLSFNDLIKQKGGWIGSATSELKMQPGQPDWFNNKTIAFQEAFRKCQVEYAEAYSLNIDATSTSKFLKDAQQVIPNFKEEDLTDSVKMNQLFDKMVGVADAKLDQMLDELGADKEEFKRAPREQRHDLWERSLEINTVTSAIAEIPGMIAVKTYEGKDNFDKTIVGVVCAHTQNTKRFADEILNAEGKITPSEEKGENLYKKFSGDDELLLGEFGIRKMRDQDGYPILISFGHYGAFQNIEDEDQKSINREHAREQAKKLAQHQVAMFLAGYVEARKASNIKKTLKKTGIVNDRNQKRSEKLDEVLSSLENISKYEASVRDLVNLVPLYDWAIPHPQPEDSEVDYSQWEIFGVVLKYDPRGEKQMRCSRDPESCASEEEPDQVTEETSHTNESQNLMKGSDF